MLNFILLFEKPRKKKNNKNLHLRINEFPIGQFKNVMDLSEYE